MANRVRAGSIVQHLDMAESGPLRGDEHSSGLHRAPSKRGYRKRAT